MGLKKFIQKAKENVTIKSFKYPLIFSLSVIFAINVVILLVAAFIALSIDVDKIYFKNFLEAFIMGSAKWMILPNSLSTFTKECSYNWELTLLCAVVVIIEMVLFSGVIIATITAALKDYIEKKTSAKGPLPLDNHIVILNWNSKVPEMVLNLYKGNINKTIIILSDHKKDDIINEINSVISLDNLKKEKIKLNLLVRTGSPLLKSELEEVGIEKADKVFILSPEHNDEDSSAVITNSDLESLKLVLLLSNFKLKKDVNVVVEVESFETKERIDKVVSTTDDLKDYNINAISFNQKLGQILAQVIIEPELSKIYAEFLSYEGNEFYTNGEVDVDYYLDNYNSSIPVLKLKQIHVLAENKENISSKRSTPLVGYKKIVPTSNHSDRKIIIYTVGNNKKKKFLLENLEEYHRQENANFLFVDCGRNIDPDEIEAINESVLGNKSDQVKILLLSDDSLSEKAVDANVFVNLIEAKNRIIESPKISFVTEILDSKNINSITKLNIENAIISNRLISFLLIQIAFNEESREFYESMFRANIKNTHDDFDIVIKDVNRLFDINGLVYETYAELVRSIYYSFDRAIMPIGVVRKENKIKQYYYFNKDMDKVVNFSFKEDDQLMFIEY